MRIFNVLHVTGLKMINYVSFCLIGLYQIKKIAQDGEMRFSFLKGFSLIFFTGIFSFLLFAIFIFIFSQIDSSLNNVYFHFAEGDQQITPFILVFFKGSAASIIIALIVAIYSEKFSDKKREEKA
jgi:uncharacterized BrkB/YihY/UPF0761 family membrane protein